MAFFISPLVNLKTSAEFKKQFGYWIFIPLISCVVSIISSNVDTYENKNELVNIQKLSTALLFISLVFFGLSCISYLRYIYLFYIASTIVFLSGTIDDIIVFSNKKSFSERSFVLCIICAICLILTLIYKLIKVFRR